MDKFLETHKLPKLTQEEIEYMSKPVKKGKRVNQSSKTTQRRKARDQMASLVSSTRNLKKNHASCTQTFPKS